MGHVPPARDRRPSKGYPWLMRGRPGATAIRSLILPPPFLRSVPNRHYFTVEGDYGGLVLERVRIGISIPLHIIKLPNPLL